MKNTPVKVILALMIATALLGFASIFEVNIAKAATGPIVFVDPANNIFPAALMPVGSTFSVNVSIANVTGIAGVQFTLNWDPTLLQCDSMTDVFFHDPLLTKPGDIPGNIQDYSSGIDNTLGTAAYAMTWKDGNKAKNNGYSPANITKTGSAYGNPAFAWPEGKHGCAAFVFEVIKVGNVNSALHLTDVIIGDVNALPISHIDIDGVYQLTVPQPSPPHFSVSPTSYNATNLGQIFNISVYVNNLDSQLAAVSFEFKLGYNSTILNIVHVYEGPWLKTFGVPPNGGTLFTSSFGSNYTQVRDSVVADANGTWHEPYPSAANPNGVALAIIEFNATYQGALGQRLECPLTLYDTKVLDWHGTPISQNASVSGLYSITNSMPGDLNGDQEVNILDSIIIADLFGTDSTSPNWSSAADLNGDGVINILDVILLVSHFRSKT